MALRKKSVVLGTSTASQTVGLGSNAVLVKRIDYLSSADTSVAASVVDYTSQTVDEVVSGSYTTRLVHQFSGGEVAVSPVTVAATGLGSGNFTVEIYYEV